MRLIILIHILTGLIFVKADAGQNAAPSSHLVYNDANFAGNILINEVRVPKDGEAMFTYYEALGWGGKGAGYAGIQAHPKAHNYIFSVWDHKNHTAPIRAVHRGPGTLTENFGGEGTGLKSWNFELGWDTDVWYTLIARCWPVSDHTFYGYWVRSAKTKEWTHMVTMDVAVKDAHFLGGNDSFIEDWLETGKNSRTTHLRNGWKRKLTGQWHAFGSAKYSVNSWDLKKGKRSFNFKNNWNGGVAKDSEGEYYFMVAGGSNTRPTTNNPSSHSIKRNEKRPGYAPIKIHSASAKLIGKEKANVSWKIDPKSLPQFSYAIIAYDKLDEKNQRIGYLESIEPHVRSAELTLSKLIDPDRLQIWIKCTDVLDNVTQSVKCD